MNLVPLVQLLVSLYFIITSISFSTLYLPAMGLSSLAEGERAARNTIFETGGVWLNAFAAYTNLIAPSEFVLNIDEQEYAIHKALRPSTVKDFIRAFKNKPYLKSVSHREIMISNHQIYADWIYLWTFLSHIQRAGSIKIVMKKELGDIPVVGMAMRLLGFIFLHRDWEKDREAFNKNLQQLDQYNLPYHLLLFPEGTTMWKGGLEKSKDFARKNGFPEMERVLLPRSTGLYAAILALKSKAEEEGPDIGVQGILDLTVGYSGVGADRMPDSVYGLTTIYSGKKSPKEIHINVSYIPLSSIPLETKEDFTHWLNERFERKDRLLEHFYKEESFPGAIQLRKDLAPASSYFSLVHYVFLVHLFMWMIYKIIF